VVIDNATTLDHSSEFSLSCTAYVHRLIVLAAISILKISKSNLAPYLDLKGGEKSYFSGIIFLRKMSLESDDLTGRAAVILSQMWTSNRIFKRADRIVNGLGALHIRSRLAMSVVFDSFWWWREEFSGVQNPYPDMEEDFVAKDTENVTRGGTLKDGKSGTVLPGCFEQLFPLPASDEYFPDYDWAASIDFPTQNLPVADLGDSRLQSQNQRR